MWFFASNPLCIHSHWQRKKNGIVVQSQPMTIVYKREITMEIWCIKKYWTKMLVEIYLSLSFLFFFTMAAFLIRYHNFLLPALNVLCYACLNTEHWAWTIFYSSILTVLLCFLHSHSWSMVNRKTFFLAVTTNGSANSEQSSIRFQTVWYVHTAFYTL